MRRAVGFVLVFGGLYAAAVRLLEEVDRRIDAPHAPLPELPAPGATEV
jgi:hypothetical protein